MSSSDRQMPRDPEHQKEITDRLMSALQRDEFVLYSQSIVPLVPQRDDRPFQEIFVRFKEEDDKLLPPGTFFPVLEECRMLPYLDRWVVNRLARVVRSEMQIRSEWNVPRYNVNLSDETLVDPNFADYVLQYVDDSYLSGGGLGFEVSCESAITNQEALRRLMSGLHPHGCSLTLSGIDDADQLLAALKTLAPDFVKISARTVDPAKVSEINRVSHGSGATTIAEHVENYRVLDHLRRCKIDFGQGFEISPVEPLQAKSRKAVNAVTT